MATTVEPQRGSTSRLTEEELLSAMPTRSANREVKVGLFVLLGVVAFLAAIFTFTDVGTFRGRYYLTTTVANAGGMRRGDPVQMRGVNIGRVVEFGMAPGTPGVQIRMEIGDEYKVPEGSSAELQSSGLLGGMVVNIRPSASTKPVRDGASIPGTTAAGLMDTAAGLGTRADTVLMRANALLAPTTAQAVGKSAVELQTLIAELNALATEQRTQLSALSTSLRRTSAGAERLTTGPELQRSVARVDSLTAQLDQTTRNLNTASVALNSVIGRMDRGEGTLGKLSRDDSLYVNMNQAVVNLKQLVADIQANPKKYINVSVF